MLGCSASVGGALTNPWGLGHASGDSLGAICFGVFKADAALRSAVMAGATHLWRRLALAPLACMGVMHLVMAHRRLSQSKTVRTGLTYALLRPVENGLSERMCYASFPSQGALGGG